MAGSRVIALSALLSTSLTAVVTAPSSGVTRKFQVAPHWHDLVLLYEYFHGDNCVEIGPAIMHLFATTTAQQQVIERARRLWKRNCPGRVTWGRR
jgi:hypothetical protein